MIYLQRTRIFLTFQEPENLFKGTSSVRQAVQPELEFLNNLWGLGTE
jgi:hypothetical protein